MFFYYKKKKHKKHGKKSGGKCYNTSGCLKDKKRFGLTQIEMDNLMSQLRDKPKIFIEF